MGRLYVPSTPASRGEVEVDEDARASLLPEGMSHEETVAALEVLAAELGYQLVEIEVEPVKPEDEPAGNASRDDWATYALGLDGVTGLDLLGEDGNDLGRDALRDKFATPSE